MADDKMREARLVALARNIVSYADVQPFPREYVQIALGLIASWDAEKGGATPTALAEQPAQGEPTCPHCKAVMHPVHFVGYYDEFHHWSCDCEILPNAVKERGGYA